MVYRADADNLKDNFFGILNPGVLEIFLALDSRPFHSDSLSGFFGISRERTQEAIFLLKNILAIDNSEEKLILTKIGSALVCHLKAIFEEISSEKFNMAVFDA